MKKITFFSFFLLLAMFASGQGRRLEVLFLGDNGHHRPLDRFPTLAAALGTKGINFTYTDDLADLNLPNLNKYDALVIYANWDEIKPEAEKALLAYVASGKGLVPIHCASYCFRNSAEYVKMVGGQFWRHRMDSIRTETVQGTHPIMQGLSPFTAFDETYLHDKLQADNNVLAVRDIKADQFADKPNTKTEPYTWTRTHGQGRIFYTAYGHDDRTWSQRGFQELIYRGILWASGDEAANALKALNPQPFSYREAKLPNYEQRPGVQLQQLPLSPEESMKHIQVPVDFDLQLFAAEPNVMHPIALTWDERGRLYVLITKDYPNERKPEGGSDYILLCEDTNADGKADKFTKFAEGLSIPTGMVFSQGGLVVSQAPDMLFLKDTDGDDKADVKTKLFSGFGTFDTHAGPSNLHYGFDNWIWGCVGYSGYKGKTAQGDSLKFWQAFFRFKFNPDKAEDNQIEWVTTTNNNTWGFGFNESNDVFGSTANNAHGWYMAIPHRYFNSANGIDNGSRSTDTHKDMKPITEKVRQVDAFGGFTAAAGHNFYTARAFPKKYWNKIAFVAEPTGHILHQNNLVKKGTDFSDKESFNLMAGADEWFSPVYAEVGPDGAVWVADWYSYIIQHNPVPKGFDNGDGNAYATDLRDFTHGRIYRVGYKNAPTYKAPVLDKNDANSLLSALKNDNLFWRLNAQRLLTERGKIDIVPALEALLADNSMDEIGLNAPAIHALWTLKNLNSLRPETIEIALKHPSAAVRKNAVQVMDNTAASVAMILKHDLLNDKEPLVVLNALLVLSKSPMNAQAEQSFFKKLNESDEVGDRWLPDAYACVLTANGGSLMKKHLAQQIRKTVPARHENHDAHQHHAAQQEIAQTSEGVDLVIQNILIEPTQPAARERINVHIEVKNQGKTALPKGKILPLDLRFEGMGQKIEQVSRTHEAGIAAGETVTISKGTNGPWVGPLGFYTDVAGDYNLRVEIDKNNELSESDKTNNTQTKKITFSAPQSMVNYALERAIRSYASVAEADSLVAIIKQTQGTNLQNQFVKAISEGWNYKRAVAVNTTNQTFLLSQPQSNERFVRLLKAWNVLKEEKTDKDVQIIRIKAVREAMKFDLKEFKVKAGKPVEIIFENPDAMQHNMVVGKPKSMEKIGLAADKMMMDEKGAEKNYVPELAEVLFSTPLINPDQTYHFKFIAPTETGTYPFICTFPGHWRLMNGVMKVTK